MAGSIIVQPAGRRRWLEQLRFLRWEQLERRGREPAVGELAGDFGLAHNGAHAASGVVVFFQVGDFKSVHEITRAFVTDREVAALLSFQAKLALAACGFDNGRPVQLHRDRRRWFRSAACNQG